MMSFGLGSKSGFQNFAAPPWLPVSPKKWERVSRLYIALPVDRRHCDCGPIMGG